MQFEVVQYLDAPLDVVEATFADPRFQEELARLPKLGQPELLERREDGDTIFQRVHHVFDGDLSSAVKAVIDPAKLTWVEESVEDRRTHRTRITIVPDFYSGAFESYGLIQLEPHGSDQTIRTATGEVTVRVPLFGSKVEAAIISGLHEHAELEEEAFNDWVSSRR
ncbi:MAG: DUF2505 domain-containing protein [Actinomycetota bacterium]|nr:DUF2505 domain-containing protein [Actinomycetota bacterium]